MLVDCVGLCYPERRRVASAIVAAFNAGYHDW
jgi:hypothetical protein